MCEQLCLATAVHKQCDNTEDTAHCVLVWFSQGLRRQSSASTSRESSTPSNNHEPHVHSRDPACVQQRREFASSGCQTVSHEKHVFVFVCFCWSPSTALYVHWRHIYAAQEITYSIFHCVVELWSVFLESMLESSTRESNLRIEDCRACANVLVVAYQAHCVFVFLHVHETELIDAHIGLSNSCILCSQNMWAIIGRFDWNRLPTAELERHDL